MIYAFGGGSSGASSQPHSNFAILEQTTAVYTTADKNKLDALSPNFKGLHATAAGLQAAHPTGSSGDFAIVQATNTFWYWNTIDGLWTNTGSSQIVIQVVDNLDSTSPTAALSARMGNVLIQILRTHWRTLSGFIATPNATNQIATTTDLRGLISKNDALKYRVSGVDYYGIIKDITATTINVAGFPINGDIEALSFSFETFEINIPLAIESFATLTVSDILKTKENIEIIVPNDCFLCEMLISAKTSDTGTKSRINAMNGLNAVFSANTNKGVSIDGTNFSIKNSSGITATANYYFAADTPIELQSDNAGNKNSNDVLVKLKFVRK